MGFEPITSVWKTEDLPLIYIRNTSKKRLFNNVIKLTTIYVLFFKGLVLTLYKEVKNITKDKDITYKIKNHSYIVIN